MFISKKKFEEEKGRWYLSGAQEEKISRDRAIKEQAAAIKTCSVLLKNIQESVTRMAGTKKMADRKDMAEATCGDIEQITHALDKAVREIML